MDKKSRYILLPFKSQESVKAGIHYVTFTQISPTVCSLDKSRRFWSQLTDFTENWMVYDGHRQRFFPSGLRTSKHVWYCEPVLQHTAYTRSHTNALGSVFFCDLAQCVITTTILVIFCKSVFVSFTRRLEACVCLKQCQSLVVCDPHLFNVWCPVFFTKSASVWCLVYSKHCSFLYIFSTFYNNNTHAVIIDYDNRTTQNYRKL